MLWIINGKRLKNILLIIIAAFFAALILFVQRQETDVDVFTPIKAHGALSHVETNQKHLALTFDINWGDQQAPLILKALKEENVKATFFISGEWAERHPSLVRQMVRAGHEVESHGMRHEDYTQLEVQRLRSDILFGRESIYKTIGQHPEMIRPPYGKVNRDVLKTAANLNQQVVLWSVNPRDETNPGAKVIVQRVLEKAGKGDIIKLHASDSAKGTDRALPLIIRELENRGFQFVTVKTLTSDVQSKSKLMD
ncbi:polysaccharide deacetylase [Sporolactobacillus inulinus]|jgi:polysaccharide deacetylase family sporulation protein PdaB|uniref:Polysaccharide deacetylase n=1 Tax=Sporolactobacillus inulinus TaxID=2078 RepID=A0A4Y1ZG85_9BACL|nr:polysaccharide deacetylase family protein [Sporolactobacillus inulinus]GAY77934.1 polysaccharide deacetylase [Sporolactobacillus inulinus]